MSQRFTSPLKPLLLAIASGFTLPAHADTVLPEITVEASPVRDIDQLIPARVTGPTRFAADPLQLPQSSQSITASAIDEQGLRQMGDVLDNVPSANAGHTRLAPFASFSWTIRGLDASVTRNGFRQLYFEDVDQSSLRNIAQIDVIKGPGATALGKEGLGGVIAIQTRRPETDFAANADLSIGSYDGRIAGFDVTGGLADSGFSARLNGEIERSGSFVARQDMDRDNLALALAFDRGGPVRGHVNAEYQNRESLPHPGLPVVGTVKSNGVGQVAPDAYLGNPDFDTLHTWAPLVQAWLEFDLAEGWTLSPRYQWFTFNVNQQQTQLRDPVSGQPGYIARSGRFDFHERDSTQTWQLELQGKPQTGAIRHEMLAGVEQNAHRWHGDWYTYSAMPPVNSLDPVYLDTPPARGSQILFSGTMDSTEFYLQDLAHLTDTISVLAGARYTQLDISTPDAPQQDNRGWSWQLGATWQFIPGTALFAGASTGLSADNIVGAVSASGKAFEPERSRQFEVGVKHRAGPLALNVALFDLRLLNATTSDPDNPDYQVQTGEQRVRGLEIDGGWQLAAATYLGAGVAFMDGKVTRSNDGLTGKKLANLPRVQGNVWLRQSFAAGFSAFARLNASGERYGNQSNSYELPGYATVDLGAGWAFSRHWRTDLTLSNALDKVFYTGNGNRSVYPGEPRTVWLKLSGSL